MQTVVSPVSDFEGNGAPESKPGRLKSRKKTGSFLNGNQCLDVMHPSAHDRHDLCQ
jgi:hypothetical protein